MAAGAEHLKERVSDYYTTKRAKPASEGYTGTLAGNWNEERFDSRLVSTGGKRAALPTELDHTWRSTYGAMNDERQQKQGGAAQAGNTKQLSETTSTLLDTLSGRAMPSAKHLSQGSLVDVVDGRHRAFPGHQPERDLPDKNGLLPREVPPTTVTRESYIPPEEHRRRQQVNAADLYYGPAHDKARYVIFKLTQALQNRGLSARQAAAAAAAGGSDANQQHVRTNFSFPALRRELFAAERCPPVPGISKRPGSVTRQELGRGLAAYGVPVDEAELVCFFKYLDHDGSGEVDVVSTVATVRGQMNDRRRGIVARAFRLLETTVGHKKNIPHGQPIAVLFSDVLAYFDAEHHPDVVNGFHSREFVSAQLFEDYFSIKTESAREAQRKSVVTLDAFQAIYEDWSALVDADHYFERCVRDAWHLSGGEGLARNTSCLRVQVVHTNGRITQQEIRDDLGVSDADDAAMRANLLAQGIKDVKRITVLPRATA